MSYAIKLANVLDFDVVDEKVISGKEWHEIDPNLMYLITAQDQTKEMKYNPIFIIKMDDNMRTYNRKNIYIIKYSFVNKKLKMFNRLFFTDRGFCLFKFLPKQDIPDEDMEYEYIPRDKITVMKLRPIKEKVKKTLAMNYMTYFIKRQMESSYHDNDFCYSDDSD